MPGPGFLQLFIIIIGKRVNNLLVIDWNKDIDDPDGDDQKDTEDHSQLEPWIARGPHVRQQSPQF